MRPTHYKKWFLSGNINTKCSNKRETSEYIGAAHQPEDDEEQLIDVSNLENNTEHKDARIIRTENCEVEEIKRPNTKVDNFEQYSTEEYGWAILRKRLLSGLPKSTKRSYKKHVIIKYDKSNVYYNNY